MGLRKHFNGYYHYDNNKRGKDRIYFSTRQTDKKLAGVAMRSELARRAASRTATFGEPARTAPSSPPPLPETGPLPLGDVASRHVKAARITGRKTVRNPFGYRQLGRYVDKLVEELGADRDLFSITTEDLESLVEALEQRKPPLSGATINRRVVETLRPIFTFAHRRLGRKDPCRIAWEVIRRRTNERIRYLKKQEMQRLLAVLTPEEAILHQFTWITGLRAMEIVNLRWSEIDWHNRLITTTVKGRRWHTLPITRKLEEFLRELEKDKHPEFVFSFKPSRTRRDLGHAKDRNEPYTYAVLYKRFKAALAKAGIEDYGFHDHRHTAATLLFLATGKMRLVQALLGHRDISCCNRYLHLDTAMLALEMERMDVRDFPHHAMACSSADHEARRFGSTDGELLEGLRRENVRLVGMIADLEAMIEALRMAA